jgi:hypothetical protein
MQITPTTMLCIEDEDGTSTEVAGRFFEECGLEPEERDQLMAALQAGQSWSCGGGAGVLFTISVAGAPLCGEVLGTLHPQLGWWADTFGDLIGWTFDQSSHRLLSRHGF